jgi:maltose/moltooligosaccharide transporter
MAFLGAVLWTIANTKEYPPDDLDAFAQMKREKSGIMGNAAEILRSIGHMPVTIKRLAWVQLLVSFTAANSFPPVLTPGDPTPGGLSCAL